MPRSQTKTLMHKIYYLCCILAQNSHDRQILNRHRLRYYCLYQPVNTAPMMNTIGRADVDSNITLERVIMKAPYQHRNLVIRYILFTIGWISFVLGVIGILLPVLPTTPFLLLSAACFLRSSPRFYTWLTEHRWWGKYIRYYLNGEGIPRRIKILITTMLWITILSSALLFVKIHWLSAIMISVATIISIYIFRQPEPISKAIPEPIETIETIETIEIIEPIKTSEPSKPETRN
jgi:uncharacterized membrane protein YbaN (DUF454 family)